LQPHLTMEQYITQFIADMRAKHKPDPEPKTPYFGDGNDQNDVFGDIERYLSGGNEQRIGNVLQLIPEQFPPANQLSPLHLTQLIRAYNDLLFSWNICADIPDKLSLPITYSLLVSTLNREVYLSEDGFVTIEFCTYNSHNCPFVEVCRCDA